MQQVSDALLEMDELAKERAQPEEEAQQEERAQ
jgi:hypothetical protein